MAAKQKNVSVIKTDGTVTETEWSTFAAAGDILRQLQTIVDGYVEPVRLPFGTLIVNEEGLVRGLPLNLTASRLCGRPIVGDAALIPNGKI
jgi:hypothetical protein